MNEPMPKDDGPPNDPQDSQDGSDLNDAQQNSEVTVSELENLLADSKDRELRAHAELENVRRRLRKEMEDVRRYSSLPLLQDLLPVLDNVHRAMEAAEQSDHLQGLLEGVKLVAQQFSDVLSRHDCNVIEALGKQFDPNCHEAIGEQPDDDLAPGTVAYVAIEGYQLHDRVVRSPQVMVARKKNPAESTPSEE